MVTQTRKWRLAPVERSSTKLSSNIFCMLFIVLDFLIVSFYFIYILDWKSITRNPQIGTVKDPLICLFSEVNHVVAHLLLVPSQNTYETQEDFLVIPTPSDIFLNSTLHHQIPFLFVAQFQFISWLYFFEMPEWIQFTSSTSYNHSLSTRCTITPS